MEAIEGRVLLCAMHPGLDPASHPALAGPVVSSDEVLAADMPAGTPTAANGLPILNSRPSAPADVYLDFDGNGSSTPYDEDQNPATYNAAEQNTIYEAWRQLSQYYAIFDVNVTTVFTSSRPKAWNLLSNSQTGVGYSFINVFPNTSPQSFNPSGDARSRQSGMAHEIGHNFGLNHQSVYDLFGVKTAEYASEADPLHGPIMGVDYAGKVHKWTIGHPSGSPSNLQDDIQVIANDVKARQPAGGDGFRADDYANNLASAYALPSFAGGATQRADGIIERLTDVDAFSFVASGGNVTVDATPIFPSGADLKLDVYDSGGTLLAASDAGDTNFQTLNLDLAAGSYYALVSSHGDYGDVGSYTIGVRDLPDEWASEDIGVPGWGGYAEYDPGTGIFTHAGSGDNVSGGHDEMRFTYQSLSGDGTIVARVAEIPNTHQWATAGVDIRDSLADNAKHAGMVMSQNNGPQFMWRTSAGASSSAINNNTGTAFRPRWVKLERVGNTFRGYVSDNGVNWTQYGSATVSMGQRVYIGLLTNSQSNTKLNEAKLDGVTVTGNLGVPAPTYNEMASPANVVVTPGVGTALSVGWDAVEGATGYRVEQSSDGITFAQAGQTAADDTDFATSLLVGSMRYFFRVSALDGSGGVSAPSAAGSGVNRPSAVTGASVTSWQSTAVILNWKDTDGETGYRIERSPDGTTFSTVATVGRNIPSYTDSSVSPGVAYTYRIVPLSTQGDGAAATTTGTARLAAVSGMSFVEVLSNRITFKWNDLPNETGYRIERSTDGSAWSTLANVAAGVTQYVDAAVQPLKEYYYRVMGTIGTALSMYPTPLIGATPQAAPLPAPWASADIGAVPGRGATGSTSPSDFSMLSIGSDIWGAADQFRYTYRPLVGDGQIIARVTSVEDTDGWAKAGVMIRETLGAGSKHAAMFISPGNGIALQYRTSTGGSTNSTAGSTTLKAPIWLKMSRVGNTLHGYSSSDGVNWTELGSVTISMGSSVYVGLAATSHDAGLLNATSFANVQVSPPTVLSATLERPNRVSVVFSSDVGASLGADDLVIESMPGGSVVGTATGVVWNAATRTATFTFDTALANGNYRARLVRTGVKDAFNFSPSADYLYNFFWLSGDANDDRVVDFADLVVLAQNYNTTGGRQWVDGDFTGDGNVDFEDLVILAQNYGTSLPAGGAAVPSAAPVVDPVAQAEQWRAVFSAVPVRPRPKAARRLIPKN
jgi:regulation of enolase protein 1 (concanavalin A-like superfamily)